MIDKVQTADGIFNLIKETLVESFKLDSQLMISQSVDTSHNG